MRSDYDYLDIGTIWQSKAHGTLSLVLAIANLNLPKKYASMNPPSVTFTDGSRIFTSPVERFLELRYFVRKDEYIANKLLDVLSHPITEDEEDEQYDMDDSDDLLLAEDDEYTDKDNSVAEPVVPVQAQTKAEHSEESKKEVITAQTITSTPASYPVQFVFETLDDPELENDLTNAAKALIRYDQFRTIDGVLYHHLAFAQNNNAVHTLISNVDKLKNCSIQYKDVIIPVNLDLVTSAYTSAENIFDITGKFVDIKLVDNLIIADTTNLEDEDEDEEYTTESFAELVSNHDQPSSVDTASEITSNSESRADSETTSTITTGDVRESGESDNAESVSSGSNTFEELEEVSINADLENAEELDEDTSIPVEDSSEAEPEDDSTEEDHDLLVNSLIMPEDEEDLGYEEIRSEDDEIADSLASKLEALIERSEDVIDAEAVESDIQSESTEEQQPEEKTEKAEEVKTTEELSSEVVDEVLTAIQEEKTQEEKKEE
mgnify:CR=1 FL=1